MSTFVLEVVNGMTSDIRKVRSSAGNNPSLRALACVRYAAALMRVSRGFHGVTGGEVLEVSRTLVRRVQRGTDDEVSQQRVSSWIRAVTFAGKRMLPNTRSHREIGSR